VGLGEGVEVGVGVKLEVGVGDGGAAVPQALNIKAAAAKRIALAIVLVFIPFSFIVCEHCHRMGWLCEGRCISEAHRPVRGYHPRELPKRGSTPEWGCGSGGTGETPSQLSLISGGKRGRAL